MSDEKISSEFEESVKKWVLLDNKLKQATEATAEWKKEKERLTTFMIDYMRSEGLEKSQINLPDGSLKMMVSNTTVPMSQKIILERLNLFFKNQAKAKECYDFVYSERQKRENYSIRRTQN